MDFTWQMATMYNVCNSSQKILLLHITVQYICVCAFGRVITAAVILTSFSLLLWSK